MMREETMTEREGVSRRAFLKQGCALTAGGIGGAALAGGCVSKWQTESITGFMTGSSRVLNQQSSMSYRRLGKTNLMVSEVVLGGHFNDPQGRPSWDHFANGELPASVAQNRAEVISKCLDYGINFVDITSAGEAQAYGAALKGLRERVYLAADDSEYAMRQERHRNPEGQMQNIESCLSKLKTDYLDIWRPQFKHTGGHRDLEVEMCIEVFEKAHRQGKARFLGMSTHDRIWAQHVLERFPQFMVIYIPYTLKAKAKPASLTAIDRTQLYEPQDREWLLKDMGQGILATARQRDVGVITTKPFSAGLIFSPGPQEFGRPDRATDADRELARLTLAYILANPDISGVAVGMSLPGHVDNNVRVCAEKPAPLENGGAAKLRQAAERMWTQLPQEYGWLRHWEHV